MNNERMICRQIFGDLPPESRPHRGAAPIRPKRGAKRTQFAHGDLQYMHEMPDEPSDVVAASSLNTEAQHHGPRVSHSSRMLASLLMDEEDECDEASVSPREMSGTGESAARAPRADAPAGSMPPLSSGVFAPPASAGPRRLLFQATPSEVSSEGASALASVRSTEDHSAHAQTRPRRELPDASAQRRQRFRRRRSRGVPSSSAQSETEPEHREGSHRRLPSGLRSGPARRALDLSDVDAADTSQDNAGGGLRATSSRVRGVRTALFASGGDASGARGRGVGSRRRRGGYSDIDGGSNEYEESKLPDHDCDDALMDMDMDVDSGSGIGGGGGFEQNAASNQEYEAGAGGSLLAGLRSGDESSMDHSVDPCPGHGSMLSPGEIPRADTESGSGSVEADSIQRGDEDGNGDGDGDGASTANSQQSEEEDSLALAMRLMEEEQRMAVQRLQHASYQMALAQMGVAGMEGAGVGEGQDESQALALQLMQEELSGRVGGDEALQGYAEAARAAQEAEVMEQSVVDAAGEGGDAGGDGRHGDAVLEEHADGRDYDALLALGARLGDVRQERWAARSESVVDGLAVRVFSDADMDKGVRGRAAGRPCKTKAASKPKAQLSAAVLAALAKAGVSADDSSDDEDEDGPACSICMCGFEAGDEVARLPHCGHDFHKGCVATWIRSNNSCPVCKAKVENSPVQSMPVAAGVGGVEDSARAPLDAASVAATRGAAARAAGGRESPSLERADRSGNRNRNRGSVNLSASGLARDSEEADDEAGEGAPGNRSMVIDSPSSPSPSPSLEQASVPPAMPRRLAASPSPAQITAGARSRRRGSVRGVDEGGSPGSSHGSAVDEQGTKHPMDEPRRSPALR